jgi:selenocysteine lyase/cysteine desulfurase
MLAVSEFAQKNHESGPLVYRLWMDNADCLRDLVANMLNAASAKEISLLKNTTDGINVLANGVDWQVGDNIVTTAGDFPSNRLPWEALADRGVELRSVELRSNSDPETALLNAMDERTRLLAVSSVQWTDGFRLNLEPLGAACRAGDVLFFVDAIQHFGALRLDVRKDNIDLVSAGSHKWQMGPEGMAVFYCRDEVREKLHPPQIGWHMLEDRLAFDVPGRAVEASGRRFEAGTPNRLGQVALRASLDLLRKTGLDLVEASVLANTEQLMRGLSVISGIELVSETALNRRSGIVAFGVHGQPVESILAGLRKTDVIAIRRGNWVRLSPHFYQHGLQIEPLLERIEHVVRSGSGSNT